MLYVKMESILFFSLLKNPLLEKVEENGGLRGQRPRGEQKIAPLNRWKGGLPPYFI
jgi:hypothetical protein